MLVVQKFGGTSVGSVERIQAVAQRVAKAAQEHSVVVVVSAMGKTTDGLVKLAHEISSTPNRREMDMLLSTGEQVSIALLSMALQELGQPAISMTGGQVGIVTEAEHTRARILHIKTERLQRHLDRGKVVVVAGFQGITGRDLEITTLGRGGSATSAVALAAALQADQCEIYTDVPGILTTDPRIVPEAQLMDQITCDEMLELASLGAKVLHPRAVEIARNYGMPLVVRSSWSDEPGTRVVSPARQSRPLEGLELTHPVDAVELDSDQSAVSLLRVPDRPGIAAKLFGGIATQDLNVDLIIQSIHESNINDITFTVTQGCFKPAIAVAEAILPTLGTLEEKLGHPEVKADDTPIAKVSIAGAGMIGRPKVAAQMFTALAEAGINIQMISTSEVKVSCVVAAADCQRAVETLRHCFELEANAESVQNNAQTSDPTLPAVRGVALDRNQARLAIRYVPDHPGRAAHIFAVLAEHNISVDMIIQSQRCHRVGDVLTRDIAFTVAQTDADEAEKLLQQIITELGCGELVVNRAIAKVSAVGAGMVNFPGVAARMFEALAQEQINISMIATSEIKISCVVDEAEGVKALQTIHSAFGLSGHLNTVSSAVA
ncbi:MAG: aspartate kinase [Microcoleaceae cyanobacterium]